MKVLLLKNKINQILIKIIKMNNKQWLMKNILQVIIVINSNKMYRQ